MKKITIFLGVLIFLAGCASSNNYVVLRDVPPNPSFAVIAANNFLYQHDFANKVEEVLVNLGVTVFTPPASKEVMTKKGVTTDLGEKVFQGKNKADSEIFEKYYTLDESTADYLIFTEYESKRVRIVKRTLRQVIASFTTNFFDKSALKKDVYKALKELNIPVKNPPELKRSPLGFFQ